MNHFITPTEGRTAEVLNAQGQSDIILVCEHASNFIPDHLRNLGLKDTELTSHVAWDPGASGVAMEMARLLDAPLVVSCVSRLVYDCNRPPQAEDAMPSRSEVVEIPGNAGLTTAERQARAETYYTPFRDLLARTVAAKTTPVIVTIHSFTPIYNGAPRSVEIGLLHDEDARLADAMLSTAPKFTSYNVLRNEPYGPQHGVTHTLKEHALPRGYQNAMIEIRNDLIREDSAQGQMAEMLTRWISATLPHTVKTQ